MMKAKYIATLSLILVMFAGLTPTSIYADKRTDEDKPIRLSVTESAGPIGKIESMSPIPINGRVTLGEQLIWGGEILQAPADSSVRVSLGSTGQVTLYRGSVAKFSVTWKKNDDNIPGSVLIASLLHGHVAVRLQDNAEAYIEASGSALVSSRGASFNVSAGEKGPVWNAVAGTVEVAPQTGTQGNYMIRPVGGRANIDVRLRKTREVQFIVTDQNDKPVPDVPVVLTISGSAATLGSGATTVTVTTTAAGIASAPVSAGAAVGAGTITAAVPGGATATVGVSAVPAGILTGTAIGVIAAAAAAGTAATVVVVKKNDKSEITPTSQPRITPSSVR
jgi:hypothetical protein